MKSQNRVVAGLKLLVVVLTVAAFMGVAAAQAAALPNQVVVKTQEIGSGIIVVESVTAAQDGWIVIYKNPNFTTGAIVGYAPVRQGANTNVKVTIDTEKISDQPTLWARLHVDNEVKGLLEVGQGDLADNDGPVVQNGQDVVTAFGTATRFAAAAETVSTAAAPAPAPVVSRPVKTTKPAAALLNQIVVKSQGINSGVIVVESVTAAQDGWIVIYKNPNFTLGEIVGYAPVRQGTNTNVKVTIDSAKIGDQPTLWARLHVDNEVKGLLEVGQGDLADNDGPVVQNGQAVVATFGTS
jgi:hypothetical protein